MDNGNAPEQIFKKFGHRDWKWISGSEVAIARWVRFKCAFGCPSYGCGACPPNVPELDACRELFREYGRIAVLRFEHAAGGAEQSRAWAAEVNRGLVDLERALFRAGHYRALALFIECCRLCESCAATRAGCADKAAARPSPEALGVDVFATVRTAGYPIQTLADFTDTMNRYAFLLVD
jgi:predicted metal-binding protein